MKYFALFAVVSVTAAVVTYAVLSYIAAYTFMPTMLI